MTTMSGSHVFITGGSEGIGAAAGEEAVRRGARVTVMARRPGPLAAAVDRLRALGGDADGVVGDVTVDDQVTGAVAAATARFGPVDVLVCAAGFARPGYVTQMATADFVEHCEVNYLGTVRPCLAVLGEMVARRAGHLALVSSTAGLLGVYGLSSYAPTKFAVVGLAECLRAELVEHGVRVSVLFPPDTDTPGFARENLTKPPETHAVSNTIAPRSVDRVARALIDGVEADRFRIYADPTTSLLARVGGLIDGPLRRYADTVVRTAQRTSR